MITESRFFVKAVPRGEIKNKNINKREGGRYEEIRK